MRRKQSSLAILFVVTIWLGVLGTIAMRVYESVTSDNSPFNVNFKTVDDIVNGSN